MRKGGVLDSHPCFDRLFADLRKKILPLAGIPAWLALGGLAWAGDSEIPPPPEDPASVSSPAPRPTPAPYHYHLPARLSDGWPVGDLRREKADLDRISAGVNRVLQGQIPRMHSLLVVRHGKLLLEEYFEGFKADSLQPLNSCTKSVFSTVCGIAQDQGLLRLDQKIYDLYPEWRKKAGWIPEKEGITVGTLLAMTSGLDCSDLGDWQTSCAAVMGRSKDWLGYCFNLPMAHEPGKAWMYNGGCLSLVSNLIAVKSGMSFPDFAQKYLLDPLGIPGGQWVTGPQGVNRVDYGLNWKSRDMAKLGQLYLDGGMWRGKRIVSDAWVMDATALHSPPGEAFGHDYGYLWHLQKLQYQGKSLRVFYANGYAGQNILVSPDLGLVCVMTADNPDNSIYGLEMNLFQDDILGSFH